MYFFSKKMVQRVSFWKNSDSKNGTFLKIWLSNKNMTQRIEPFLLWLGELIFLRLKELNFSSNMARRIELFLFSISQRMGVFLVWLKELNFLIWVKDFNFFFSNTQRVTPFFFQYDAKNWTLFFEYDAKKWTPFSFIWRKELKHLIKKYDSKNWAVCQKKKRLKEWNSL